MDKTLLKAYIRTIVEEEVKRILPELLSEAVMEVKQITESAQPTVAPKKRPSIDKGRLAQLMGIEYDRDGGTIRATTSGLRSNTVTTKDAAGNPVEIPTSAVKAEVVDAINRDYSQLMKAMKLS
jgi:hypothetical protein